MKFLISDSFTDSLTKLTGEEQKNVKITVFDMQSDPSNPGLRFHRINNAKDPNFWSIRSNRDIRIIVHKTASSFLVCYVDHHDDAYKWAERRRFERHPKTGAAQFVEIRETVKEIEVPQYVHVEKEIVKPLLFDTLDSDELLSFGVPEDWVDDVKVANEDSFLEIYDHLPHEAGEALLQLATGGQPSVVDPIPADTSAFDHPDAQRRFRVVEDIEELEAALDYPWEKWSVFLHPAQRAIVERDFDGPARVSGSAGTGKTIVALHRAVYLARQNLDARILLTTFSSTLAENLKKKLRILVGNRPRTLNQIEVYALDDVAKRLYGSNIGELKLASPDEISGFIDEAAAAVPDHKFSQHFLETEWNQIVDPWQSRSWEDYQDVVRLGRKTRFPEAQLVELWKIFEIVRSKLDKHGLKTHADMYTDLSGLFAERDAKPYDFAVIDESQDISVFQLKFLSALSSVEPNALFFAGDLGQRIFRHPFSWKSVGIDVEGRSETLKINYRTSHQIREQSDRLLESTIADVDGIKEKRSDTISVFNGPKPEIEVCSSIEEEKDLVAKWVSARVSDGIALSEIGVCVRSKNELERATASLEVHEFKYDVLNGEPTESDGISVATMHRAKGLEFKAMVVMACDDDVIPSQERIELVADESDLEEVYNTERHLLYVACTRARDHLLVTGVDPVSEFVEDMETRAGDSERKGRTM